MVLSLDLLHSSFPAETLGCFIRPKSYGDPHPRPAARRSSHRFKEARLSVEGLPASRFSTLTSSSKSGQ
jgi:hypothetical protein